jgi:hypothetical protein
MSGMKCRFVWLALSVLQATPAPASSPQDIEELKRRGQVSSFDAELRLGYIELARNQVRSARSRASFVLARSSSVELQKQAAKLWWSSCRLNPACIHEFWRRESIQDAHGLAFVEHFEPQSMPASAPRDLIIGSLSLAQVPDCKTVSWLHRLGVRGERVLLFHKNLSQCAAQLESFPKGKRFALARELGDLTQGHASLSSVGILASLATGQHNQACRTWAGVHENALAIDFRLANRVCRSLSSKKRVLEQHGDSLKIWTQLAINQAQPQASKWLTEWAELPQVRESLITSLLEQDLNNTTLTLRSALLKNIPELVRAPSGLMALRRWVVMDPSSLRLWQQVPAEKFSESDKLQWISVNGHTNTEWLDRSLRFATELEPSPWARLVRFPKLAIALAQSSAHQQKALRWASAIAIQAIDEPRLIETLAPQIQESAFFRQIMDVYGYIKSFEVSAAGDLPFPLGLDPRLKADLGALSIIGRAKQDPSPRMDQLKKLTERHPWSHEALQELARRWLETLVKS